MKKTNDSEAKFKKDFITGLIIIGIIIICMIIWC